VRFASLPNAILGRELVPVLFTTPDPSRIGAVEKLLDEATAPHSWTMKSSLDGKGA
jgi:hypothetical protein